MFLRLGFAGLSNEQSSSRHVYERSVRGCELVFSLKCDHIATVSLRFFEASHLRPTVREITEKPTRTHRNGVCRCCGTVLVRTSAQNQPTINRFWTDDREHSHLNSRLD